MASNNKIFVVAGNYEQYKDWVKRNLAENTSISLSNFVYVNGPEVFRGFNQVHGYFVGSYRTRPDIREIVWEIRRINHIPHSQQVIPDKFDGPGVFVV